MKEFYSNGKLLLTGEYAVLDGARCLALPTVFGQTMTIAALEEAKLNWTSEDYDQQIWFRESVPMATFNTAQNSFDTDASLKEKLIGILVEAKRLNPDFMTDSKGYEVRTTLSFSKDWGLGTSSTLVNNIAEWAGISPYDLLRSTFGGSGYDIACARHNSAITYQLQNEMPMVQEVTFAPPFTDSLFFVYLNRKQDSREGIMRYRQRQVDKKAVVKALSAITDEILLCKKLSSFEHLLDEHERILSEALALPTVKASHFEDYKGSIKSLGAWGGDFVLATGNTTDQNYFKNRGYDTIVPFSKMIK